MYIQTHIHKDKHIQEDMYKITHTHVDHKHTPTNLLTHTYLQYVTKMETSIKIKGMVPEP